jgi:hypothetical protein
VNDPHRSAGTTTASPIRGQRPPGEDAAGSGRDDTQLMRRDGEIQRPLRNLMTSAEAGRWGRGGARRLMATHVWPGNDRAASMAAASAEFGGDVLTAEEGLTVGLGR